MAAAGDLDHLLGVHRAHGSQRCRISQRLAGDPVLTVRAMEIATHHTKSQRVASRVNMEVRFLLDWIALKAGNVAERNFQFRAGVEADFANIPPTASDQTAMPA